MLISVFQFIIQSAFTIGAIIFLQMGVLGKVEGEFLTRLIFACIGLFMLKNYLSFLFNKQMIIDSLKYGIPLIPHTLSSWVSNLSDRWILNLFVPLSQVGIYSLGAQFGSLLGVLLTGFNYAWVPFVMSSLKENESHAKQKISRLTTYYMGILVLLVLIIVFFAPIVLRIMATQKFYDAIPIIPYIVFAMFWQGIYFMSVNPLFYLKKTQYLAIISIISAIINISCNLLLIPIYGIYGAAISTIISYTFNAILVQGLSQHLFPIAYEYLKIGKIMGSGLIVLIVFYLISSDNMIVESVWNILLLIIYCCLIYILILNVSERREGWIVLNTGIRKCLSLLPFQR
jgi:O-antigen/teichoic acid export membrane protein